MMSAQKFCSQLKRRGEYCRRHFLTAKWREKKRNILVIYATLCSVHQPQLSQFSFLSIIHIFYSFFLCNIVFKIFNEQIHQLFNYLLTLSSMYSICVFIFFQWLNLSLSLRGFLPFKIGFFPGMLVMIIKYYKF